MIFKNIKYKNKLYFLLGITFVLSLVAYKRSFKHAITSFNHFFNLKEELAKIENSDQNFYALNKEIKLLDAFIGETNANNEAVQHNILNFMSAQKNIAITSIKETHKAQVDDFTVYTNQIVIEGGANELMETIYKCEREFEVSKIAHLNYFLDHDFRRQTKKLYVEVLFQNYEN